MTRFAPLASTVVASIVVASALVASTLACVSRPSTEGHERSSSAPERAPRKPRASCADLPAEARLLIVPERRDHACPIALVLAEPPAATPLPEGSPEPEPLGRWVALIQIPLESAPTPSEPLAIGPAPLACGPELAGCELTGFIDERHGPIVIAAERGHESEHPIQIHLGLHDAGHLVFVPSWYGESSVVDHTRIGPVFALAPFDCEGELRLLPTARLPEAAGEAVPARLMLLAGRWWLGERGQSSPPQIANPSSEGCTPLLDPLP